MTQSDAYKILNLDFPATEEKIKKAYRKMAMKHHPDRNKASNAKNRFIEIHEAYELLTNPQKQYGAHAGGQKSPTNDRKGSSNRRHHFRGKNHNFSTSSYANEKYKDFTYEERYQRARESAEAFYEKKSNALYQQFYDEYMNGWKRKWIKYVAVVAAVLSVIFVLDHYLPQKSHVATPFWQGPTFSNSDSYIKFDNNKYWVDKIIFYTYSDNVCQIIYTTTPIFKDISSINIISPSYENAENIFSGFNVTNSFPLIPLILLFPAISFLIERPKFNFIFFNVHINIYVIPALVVFLLVNDGRIFRLFGG